MLPEIQKYFAEVENVAEYERAYQQAMDDNPIPDWPRYTAPESERDAYHAAYNKRSEILREVEAAEEERKARAFRELATSEDKLVRWIAQTSEVRDEYPEHADAVLRALPLTRDEMDAFGDENAWCGEYGRLYRLADDAGVLPPRDDPADIGPLVEDLTSTYGGYELRFRSMIKKHLPAILASAQQKAAEKELATV